MKTDAELCLQVARVMGKRTRINRAGDEVLCQVLAVTKRDKRWRIFMPDMPTSDFIEVLAYLHGKLRISGAHDAIEQECVELEGEGTYEQWVCLAVASMGDE